jgi:hypothetical protein
MTTQAIKGIQTYPERKLITAEGRVPLTEKDFALHHQLLFPGEAIPELTPPWYNPDFARISYVRSPAVEECPAIGELRRFKNRP